MAYEYDFQDRMETGRQAAMDARNRGRPVGKPAPGWNKHKRPIDDTPENRAFVENADLRRRLRDLENQLAVLKLQGAGADRELDDFGAEFDKLAGRTDWRPSGPITASSPQGREAPQGTHAMNTKSYLAALKKLRLKPASKDTAKALGLGLRHCQRLAAGKTLVTPTLAKLIQQYLEHGLPDADE